MLTYREVAALDRNSEYYGVPTSELMENAGKAVAEYILSKYKHEIDSKRQRGEYFNIVVFCGPGNNGGDGYVAARYLAMNQCNVELVLLCTPDKIKTALAKTNFERIWKLLEREKAGSVPRRHGLEYVSDKIIAIASLPDALATLQPSDSKLIEYYELLAKEIDKIIDRNDMIIDAMLGVGITGELKEPYKTCIDTINRGAIRQQIPVIAVDTPTGLGTPTIIKPTCTVTFHDVKVGMNEDNSGEIVIKDIGIPEDAVRFTGPGEFVYYPKPSRSAYKGKNGRVLIVGGGPYTGAPALAGFAAFAVGVDLVYIATPRKTYPIISGYSPNFIVRQLNSEHVLTPEDEPIIAELLAHADALIIGPGLGGAPETLEAVKRIIAGCPKPLIIDANAIECVVSATSFGNHGAVITPHKGELLKITGSKLPDDLDACANHVRDIASKLKCTILLKSAVDVISDGTRIKLNRTGNPGMTVGGTGDVLAGLVGGLLAKRLEPFDAARLSAFINGYAGDLAYQSKGYSLVATDVIAYIHEVLRKFLQ
jgi:NAD(P)H-hydrate epimerase